MLGWAIGNIVPGDSRLRRWATVAAVVPDVDGIPIVFGVRYYAEYHHTFGHNVFFLLGMSAVTAKVLRSWKAGLVVFACIASHLLTDAYFTGSGLYLFWPFSWQPYTFPGGYSLSDPINIQLFYVGLFLVLLVALIYRRTPIELFSPGLDRLLMSVFRPRTLDCQSCGKKANQTCARCGQALCWAHARVERGFQIVCSACKK
jgi:membrane-bound metal-dependent hydrolase YbcI (DUF457 family)